MRDWGRRFLALTPNQAAVVRYFLLAPLGHETGLTRLFWSLPDPHRRGLTCVSGRCRALARRGFLLERRGPRGWLWRRGPLCDLLQEEGLDGAVIDGPW